MISIDMTRLEVKKKRFYPFNKASHNIYLKFEFSSCNLYILRN